MPDPIRNGGKHPFEYHKPTPEQIERMRVVNEALKAAYELMIQNASPNRERSLAITNLQQARMWFNAAVVLGG
jgi:hypothetical protein